MRLALPVLLLVVAVGTAAEPTKAELTKKIDEQKQAVAKAKKEVDELKADKDIGTAVTKDLSLWAQIAKDERQLKAFESIMVGGGTLTRAQSLQLDALEEKVAAAYKARAKLFDDPAVKKHDEKVKKYKTAFSDMAMGEQWIEMFQEQLKKAKK